MVLALVVCTGHLGSSSLATWLGRSCCGNARLQIGEVIHMIDVHVLIIRVIITAVRLIGCKKQLITYFNLFRQVFAISFFFFFFFVIVQSRRSVFEFFP